MLWTRLYLLPSSTFAKLNAQVFIMHCFSSCTESFWFSISNQNLCAPDGCSWYNKNQKYSTSPHLHLNISENLVGLNLLLNHLLSNYSPVQLGIKRRGRVPKKRKKLTIWPKLRCILWHGGKNIFLLSTWT